MANPYQWNQPVPAVQFHGHQDLLETLMGHFAQKVALRIDGDPRRGKTSLLARLQAILEASFCEVVCLDTAALIRLHQDNPRQPFARLLSPLGSRAVLIDNLEQLASASSDMPHAVEASLRALVMDDVWVVACCRWDVLAPPQCQVLDFPFFTSLVLPLFTDDDVLQLLQQGALSKEEQQFVSLVCGNEPYLVQLLAGSMSDLPPRPGRARLSGNIALATIDQSLARAWRTQQPAERWVLLVMARPSGSD